MVYALGDAFCEKASEQEKDPLESRSVTAGREGVQRAIAKPSGRARRPETHC